LFDILLSNILREPDMLMIELKRDDPMEGLGFTVAGYRTADGRYAFDIFSQTGLITNSAIRTIFM